MRIILRNLVCHRRKNTIMVLAVVFSSILLNAYAGNITGNQRQLRELADLTPVFCYITDISGLKMAGIDIKEQTIRTIAQSEYVKDMSYTIRLLGGVGSIPESEWKKLTLNVEGANRIEALSSLQREDIEMAGEIDSFFESEDNIALINSRTMESHGLKAGDTLTLTLYYLEYDDEKGIFCHPLTETDVKVVGTMADAFVSEVGISLDVLLPAGYLEKVFKEQGVPVLMDSASFYIKDPLKLNEAKKEFREIPMLSRAPGAKSSYKGVAINMKDATFISLANNLRRNIFLLEVFLPPLCILLFLLSFFISFILVRNWKKEYVIMRLLGVYTYQCVLVNCAEGFLLSVMGVVIGNVITLLVQKGNAGLAYGLPAIAACVSGAAAASWSAGKEMRDGSSWK